MATKIFEGPTWRVYSFHNGGAYSIDRVSTGETLLFLRDDAAAEFRRAWDQWEAYWPELPIEDFISEELAVYLTDPVQPYGGRAV